MIPGATARARRFRDAASRARSLAIRILPAALLFVAVAPTLSWLEFTNTPENLVVESALEIRRSGRWFLPTLEGDPRTKKPPLATWVTALAIRRSTLRGLASRDAATREAAYRALAWDVRWPALLAICLSVLAAGELGAILLNRRVAWAVAAACASSFLVLRFSRVASADALLAMWVAATNVCMARAILCRSSSARWVGCLIAGAAAGAAFMTKGPVALMLSVVPMAVWLVCRNGRREALTKWLLPALAGVLVFGAIAFPWYLAVLLRGQHQWRVWWKELSGMDAPQHADPFYAYFWMTPVVFLPWSGFVLAGAWRLMRRRSGSLSPVLRGEGGGEGSNAKEACGFYTAFSEPGRFGPVGAKLRARAFGTNRGDTPRLRKTQTDSSTRPSGDLRDSTCDPPPQPSPLRTGERGPEGRLRPARVTLAICLVVIPLIVMSCFKDKKDRYLLPLAPAVSVLAIASLRRERGMRIFSRPAPLVLGLFALMLILQAIAIATYRRTPGGQSPMKPIAQSLWARYPDADLYNAHPDAGKRADSALSIYFNRPTPWISAAALARRRPGNHAQLVLLIHRPGEPAAAAPRGWEHALGPIEHGEDFWEFFVLPAK